MKDENRRSGARALVESLAKAGTEVVFGYPGGAVLDIFDELSRAPFPFVLGRHEQGCVHAADGYARASGKVGVAIVTSGPGATNAVTGLATANIDGVPLVVVTGQVALGMVGTDAFQEADTIGITRGVTKHNFLVQSADEIPETVAEAFYIATHGKPGVVLIDVPKDCQQAATAALWPERIALRAYHPASAATPRQLDRIAKLVNESRRPVIYAGGGVIAAGASADVAALARRAEIPVATTLMGLGCFDERDPLALRMAGMHGTPAANWAINGADLILALGVRFSDRVTGNIARYAPAAKIVHVDCDPSSIGKNVDVELGVVADVKELLTALSARIRPARHEEWMAQVAAWKADSPLAVRPLHEGVIMPQQVIEAIDRVTDGEAVLVTDVGQHQMWAAQHFRHSHPRRFITSGGMGTMGFGIPAAIGAALAPRAGKVVAVCGDGGAQMTFEEVVVAVEHRLPVTFVIVNNSCLGMVRQWQELLYKKNYAASILSAKGRSAMEHIDEPPDCDYLPDFVKLAEACGAEGRRVIDPAKLEDTLAAAVRSRRTTVVEVIVDPRANVYPMIPAGGSVDDMIRGRED